MDRSKEGSGGCHCVLETGILGSHSIVCTFGTLQPIQGHSDSVRLWESIPQWKKRGNFLKAASSSTPRVRKAGSVRVVLEAPSMIAENDTA